MDNIELKEAAKRKLRKRSKDDLDKEIIRLIEVAKADMKRIGVAEGFLNNPSDALIIDAILIYVQANYELDENHERLMESYKMALTKIKGGKYKTCTRE